METLLQDVRYGLRVLGKNPGFTAIAVVTLALGIGANTALFSVVNGVLLNPLPFPEPNQLVSIHENKPNFEGGSISYPNFLDWQKENQTFSSMAIARPYAFSLTGTGQAEQVNAEFITPELFPLLGVKPVIGRTFSVEDDQIGAGPVALISEGFWKRKLGSASDVLGKSLTLDGRNFTIIGVMPVTHLLLVSFRDSEIYAPINQWNNSLLRNRGAGLGIHGIGRLKPGVSIEQARADMERVTRNLAVAYPDADKSISAKLSPLKEEMVGHVRPLLLLMLGAVGFVLLIACVNVANLLLARATGRHREFAIRAALGATQTRVLRQLLTESLLLAITAAGLGLILATWGTRAALGILPSALPRAEEIGLDARLLLFTIAISLMAGVLFGLTPAFRTSRKNVQSALQEGGRGGSGTSHRAQGVFIVTEMALALVLLAGAGLMIRSLMQLWRIDPGFNPHNVLTFGLSLPPSMMNATPEAIRAAFREVDDKFASIPGVQAVSQTWGAIPMSGDDDRAFWLEDQPKPASANDMNSAVNYIVEPDYLKAMGIPLLQGRFFNRQDNEHSPAVVVIDDVLAHRYFPNQDPIGKHIHLSGGEGLVEIVGVVGHVKQWGLDLDDSSLRSQFYFPCLQMPYDFLAMTPSGSAVVVRSDRPTSMTLASIRHASEEMSSQQVIFGVQTMEAIISRSLAARRFAMILLGIFAALALGLATVGVYGVLSYVVGQRTQEIGIRMALGAQRQDVLRMILQQGGRVMLIGVVVGLAVALWVTRFMNSLLYEVGSADPLTFVTVAAVLTLVGLGACYIPARRAARVDPMVALRYE
jgi:predicted permease